MERAAAARPGRRTRGQAGVAAPFAPLGRGRTTMMHCTLKVSVDKRHFYMGMSTSMAARSPRSVRPAPRTAWATCGRAGNMMASPWASAPPVPPPGRPDHGHGPRTSTRSRPCSATAAHGGSRPTFASSTRSRAPITRTTHHRPLSPFQTLHGRGPKVQNRASSRGVIK